MKVGLDATVVEQWSREVVLYNNKLSNTRLIVTFDDNGILGYRSSLLCSSMHSVY